MAKESPPPDISGSLLFGYCTRWKSGRRIQSGLAFAGRIADRRIPISRSGGSQLQIAIAHKNSKVLF